MTYRDTCAHVSPGRPVRRTTGGHRFSALARLALIGALLGVHSAPALAEEAAADYPQREETRSREPLDGVFYFGSLALDPEIRLTSDWLRSETRGRNDLGLSGRRLGVEAVFGRRIGFELSAELTSASPWRTVKADYRLPAGVTVTGGQFKVPLSLDGTRGASDRDFIFRSRLGDAFTLGRDRGVTVETRLWRKRLSIEGGVFANDGDRVASRLTDRAHLTRVGRVTVAPLSTGRRLFKDLRIGASAASSRLDEGKSGMALRTIAGQELTSPVYWSQGSRRRAGIDVRWRPGPFSTTAEYLAVADERRGQGNGNDDLAPLTGTGWYLEGTWFLTGEAKARRLRLRRPLQRGGWGALELVGRVERASLGESGVTPAQAGSPRALRPAESHVRVLTTGFNWYPAAGARLQFNLTREAIGGATAGSLQEMSTVLTSAVRFQLFL